MKLIVENIAQWHRDRNLIDGSTDKDQYMKIDPGSWRTIR